MRSKLPIHTCNSKNKENVSEQTSWKYAQVSHAQTWENVLVFTVCHGHLAIHFDFVGRPHNFFPNRALTFVKPALGVPPIAYNTVSFRQCLNRYKGVRFVRSGARWIWLRIWRGLERTPLKILCFTLALRLTYCHIIIDLVRQRQTQKWNYENEIRHKADAWKCINFLFSTWTVWTRR